jgi:hypothetical protein
MLEEMRKIQPLRSVIILLIEDVSISNKDGVTKFKLRCSKYLYTIKIDDEKKAEKIKGSFPNSINHFYI